MNRNSITDAENPLLTVLMPVYNCRKYIKESVSSILSQTFSDLELLIIDDGSRDNTVDMIRHINDPRIRIFQNKSNIGVAKSLNLGMEMAKGRFIARMDADDISLPNRLEDQVRFMTADPGIGISGGWIRYFGNGLPHTLRVPEKHEEIAAYMLFENPICHMTVIMRKTVVEENSLRYNEKFTRSEDYELWTRAIRTVKMSNLQKTLVRVRRNEQSATLGHWEEMTGQTEIILDRMLKKLGLNPLKKDVAFHHRVGRGYRLNTLKKIMGAEKWLKRLRGQNSVTKTFDSTVFEKETSRVWFRSCSNSTPLGLPLWKKWKTSTLSKSYKPTEKEMVTFIASLFWHGVKKTFRKV